MFASVQSSSRTNCSHRLSGLSGASLTEREPNSDQHGASGGSDTAAPRHGEGQVVIRPAKAGELPAIRRLIGLYPDELVQDELPRVSSFFVAESGDSIIGCCALQVYSRRLAEVRSLAIHPDFRGKGLAAQLVDACRRRGIERKVRQLFAVTSEPGFFEGCGFTVHTGWKTALFSNLDPDS